MFDGRKPLNSAGMETPPRQHTLFRVGPHEAWLTSDPGLDTPPVWGLAEIQENNMLWRFCLWEHKPLTLRFFGTSPEAS